MGRSRSRSRSPRRDRRRSRSRDRDRDRKHRSHRSDKRSRSRSPSSRSSRRRRSRSPRSHKDKRSHDRHRGHSSRDYDYPPAPAVEEIEYIEIQDGDDVVTIDGDDEPAGEVDMMKLMGFSGFDSTKGKHVEGNDKGTANIIHKRKYRQYMNRRGGFNRPLDFIP